MAEAPNQQYPSQDDRQYLEEVMKKANAGDLQAIAQLRKFLDQNPHVWRHVGDVAAIAERAWISQIADGERLTTEAVTRQMAEMRSELMGDSTSTTERMLVDSVIATWLEVHYLRCLDADSRNRTLTQASLLVKRLDSAQKRHHAALRDLETMRKLLPNRGAIPALRVFPYQERQA